MTFKSKGAAYKVRKVVVDEHGVYKACREYILVFAIVNRSVICPVLEVTIK